MSQSGIDVLGMHLQLNVEHELRALLARSKHNPPTLEDIWWLMDQVWDELGCDNLRLDRDRISRFYQNPVWLLNDLFIEQDSLSMQHRNAISDWIAGHRREIGTVLDYGGGFGALACLLNGKAPDMHIDIYEPFPSDYARAKVGLRKNIRFVDAPGTNYDCLLSIDVLEHVPDPLGTLMEMIRYVRTDGYLVIANCFAPVIKCHLPGTFHLRYTFGLFASVLGLEFLGPCSGSHAQLYRKLGRRQPSRKMIEIMTLMSRAAFPMLNMASTVYRAMKKIL